jgi:MFS family permease
MLVLGLYNSPFVTGLVAFAAITPSLLFYIPAGVIVDRCNPRLVMIYSELLRGGAIASVVVALLLFRHHINVWFLIFAMIVEEILEILSVLADRRYLSRLMERENRDSMASQQAFIEVRTHTAVLAGRPIGPFLFDLQPIFPFLADALSFIVSFISLLVISRTDEPVRDAPAPPQPRRQLIREIFQGISWLRSDRRAWVTITLMAMTSLVAQALILMLLAQAHSKHLSTVAIGVVLAASGAGGAVGSLCFRFLPGGLKGFWLPIQMLLWSLTLAFLWLAGGLPAAWSALAMFVLGLTGAIGNIEFGTYLVAHVADYMIARVAAVGQMLAIGACALGPVLGGYAIQRFGVEGAVVILLLIVAMLSLLCLLMPGAFQKIASVFRSLRRIFAPVQLWTNLLRTFASAPRRRRDGDPAEFPGGMPHSSSGHSSQTQGQVSCEKLVSPSSPKSVDYSQPSTSNGLICGNADVQFSSGTEKHSFDRLGASADGASTRQLDPVLPAGQLVDIDSTPFPL